MKHSSNPNDDIIVIEAGRAERHYWQDLWRYRELFYFLAWRDIMVRYKQTLIGIAWSVIRPVITMIIFTLVFGKLAKLPSEGTPYPLLVFAGLLPWYFFANSLSETSNSLIANSSLLSKVYFPRLIAPASTVLVTLVDFLISLVILTALMLWYQHLPDWKVFLLPFFLLEAMLVSLGLGLWFSSLNVKYRDFQYIVPFVVQLGMYVSPVGFSSNIVPEKWRFAYSLNPMVGVIDGFRWVLIGGDVKLYWPGFLSSVILTLFILMSGIWYFRKTERSFADVI
jgi:lipopolysaccharide transport system permease protein